MLGLLLLAQPFLAQSSSGSGDAAAGAAGLAIFTMAFGMWALWMCFIVLMMVFVAGLMVVWVWMLVDVIQRPEGAFPPGQEKILWVVLLLVAGVIGGAVYYFMVYRAMGPASTASAGAVPAPAPPGVPPPAPPSAPPPSDPPAREAEDS
jgi:heme/copper-type cytochrome/quinol oxidase subunit 2